MKLELAVEPRTLVSEAGAMTPAPASCDRAPCPPVRRPAPTALVQRVERASADMAPDVGDVAFDAQLLADYGDAPAPLAPLAALRVARAPAPARAEKGLVGRREEAKRAQPTRWRTRSSRSPNARVRRPRSTSEFAAALEELRGAEDVLRSRDRVLASEQDAQTARLAAVDARLAKLEAEVAHAQAEERTIAAELASAQAALARGESKLKRAESELRAASQREADGSHA